METSFKYGAITDDIDNEEFDFVAHISLEHTI